MMRVRGQPALILKLLVYFAVLTSACQSTLKEKDSSSPNRIVLIDAAGLEVNLERPAQRIISLVPSATQTLEALGVSHKLIGRTDFDVEDWASDIPSVGGGLEPNFEKIIALKPDLVVRFAGEQDPNTRSRLDDFGIAHLSISPDRLTDLYKSILLLGKATGAEVNEAQVKALVASLADVNIEEAIKAAPVAVAAAPAAAAEAPAGGDEKKEEKKADPPSEKQEEQAMEGLASLFG